MPILSYKLLLKWILKLDVSEIGCMFKNECIKKLSLIYTCGHLHVAHVARQWAREQLSFYSILPIFFSVVTISSQTISNKVREKKVWSDKMRVALLLTVLSSHVLYMHFCFWLTTIFIENNNKLLKIKKKLQKNE